LVITRFGSPLRTLERTNPLLILRIFATVFQQVSQKGYDARKAFEPFANFVSNEEPSPDDDIFMELIERHFLSSPHHSDLKEVINLSNFRHMNGAIHRNAQTISPVTDLHMLMSGISPTEQDNIMATINSGSQLPFATVFHVMASPMMRDLTIRGGSGLFVVANSMNHSCAPNVTVISCFNSHTARIAALRDILPGEELCFSYINENLPFRERQKLLAQLYLFSCQCSKCNQNK